MRHRVAGRILKRTVGQRRALFRSLISDLIRHERIETTEGKARAVRGDAEKIITLAKQNSVTARRLAAQTISDPELLKKLFDEVAPRYKDTPGGYTRLIKVGPRRGDAAPLVLLELVK
ncbi:MAG: 50S ribosomal protein L17 [Chloroflexi bacterium ADurb.Bin180]|nr:MAG: 50S ribosomal protein L17 [Chloroflexi bacterium ADurb.Bin180]HNR97436.1 50S ribosomal protein L17 [Anaerolineae bacterium]HQJ50689.1 50S ribosomal protein L17 [Anaerolineae bacterium]